MKILRAIFRRLGYAIILLDATDRPHVRRAVWRAQYEYAAERNGNTTLNDCLKIIELVEEKMRDSIQGESDTRAFAALVDAVEKDREP